MKESLCYYKEPNDKHQGIMKITDKPGHTNRSFLARAYPSMKQINPQIPIMLREAAGTHPRIYARYGSYGAINSNII